MGIFSKKDVAVDQPEADPAASPIDPRITKRRVTMVNLIAVPGGEERHEVVDYVRPDFLDAYVKDAKLRWQLVEVSEEPDAGPLGYDGPTYIPDGLDHPDAGRFYAATTPEGA